MNIIEVVFSDDQSVLNQWKIYYDRLCVENPNETELSKIKTEGDKLLDVMAKSLGYKEKVTWETIQKPYIPKGLSYNIIQQQKYQSTQMDLMNLASTYFHKNDSDMKNKVAESK